MLTTLFSCPSGMAVELQVVRPDYELETCPNADATLIRNSSLPDADNGVLNTTSTTNGVQYPHLVPGLASLCRAVYTLHVSIPRIPSFSTSSSSVPCWMPHAAALALIR